MANIQISIIDPSGEKKIKVGLPDNVEIQRLINALVPKVDLPQYDRNGQYLNYSLIRNNQDKTKLEPEQTLAEANIQENDEFRLLVEEPSQIILPYNSLQENQRLQEKELILSTHKDNLKIDISKEKPEIDGSRVGRKFFAERSFPKLPPSKIIQKNFGGKIDISDLHELLLNLQEQSDSDSVDAQVVFRSILGIVGEPQIQTFLQIQEENSFGIGGGEASSGYRQQKDDFKEKFRDAAYYRYYDRQSPKEDTPGNYQEHFHGTRHIFISFSPEDKHWLELFQTHLRPLEHYHDIQIVSRKNIHAGEKIYPTIFQFIQNAHVSVCLVSKHFLASELIQKNEVPRMLKQRDSGMSLVPVLIGPCGYKFVPWLNEIQLFPRGDIPLSKRTEDERDEEIVIIVEEIKDTFSPFR